MNEIATQTKQIKSVVLARVSSKAQELEGYSLDSQEKLLLEYNERLDFKVAKVFKMAESASKASQRRVFQEMMKYVRSNKIHVITVEKVDRFVRNFKDVVLTDEWLEEDNKNQVHFVKDGITLHRASKSTEKLNWGIRVVIAKNYIDNLKEEVAKGVQEKLEQGWYPSSPPVGYKTIGETGKRIHIIDEETSPLVKQVFEKYMEPGENIKSTTEFAEQIGLVTHNDHPLVKSHIAGSVLRNKFYIGVNTWCGVEYPGVQETFIDRALFEAVQNKMTRKNVTLYRKHNPDFKGLFYCSSCQGRITWEIQRGHWYGHCNFRNKDCTRVRWVRQEEIEKQLMSYFDAVTIPDPKIRDWIIPKLKEILNNGKTDNTLVIKQMEAEKERLRRQLVILYDDRLAERISLEDYDLKHKEVSSKVADIENRIRNVDDESDKKLEEGIKMLETTQKAKSEYKNMSSNDKKRLLLEIFSNGYLNEKTLEVNYTPYAQIIAKTVKKHQNPPTYFRTKRNNRYENEVKALEMYYKTLWLGIEDSN